MSITTTSLVSAFIAAACGPIYGPQQGGGQQQPPGGPQVVQGPPSGTQDPNDPNRGRDPNNDPNGNWNDPDPNRPTGPTRPTNPTRPTGPQPSNDPWSDPDPDRDPPRRPGPEPRPTGPDPRPGPGPEPRVGPEPGPEPRPTGPDPRPTGPNLPSDARALLDAHNKVRAKHCAAPLTWSAKLEQFAQQWANSLKDQGCKFGHSGGKYGENLAAGTAGTLDGGSVTGMWYDEVKLYNFGSGGFSMDTGHFTQVVWRSSTQLGCAKTNCRGMDIWVCEYDPPGNVDRGYKANVLPTSCK